jgi:hypothetical protein
MSGRFLVSRGGRDSFHTEDELRHVARVGQLDIGDLVYHPVLGRWLYAREVEEVRGELSSAQALGRPLPDTPAAAPNDDALLGFVFGLLGHLPLLGFISCLIGVYFSARGLRRAGELAGAGHGMAVTGMVMSVVFLIPATACGALLLASR